MERQFIGEPVYNVSLMECGFVFPLAINRVSSGEGLVKW